MVRTMLNDGVQVYKKDEDGKVLAAIVLPWKDVLAVASALAAESFAHELLTGVDEINKHLASNDNAS